MIVKVQLTLDSNIVGREKPGARMLVYNEDRSVMYEADTPSDVLNIMKGRPKALFHAETKKVEDGSLHLVIGKEAKWQTW